MTVSPCQPTPPISWSLNLSSFPHGAVGLIDDNDETDETIYKVSWWWSDKGDNEEIDKTHWEAMLACAHECAEAIWRSSQQTLGVSQLSNKILPQGLLLYPQEGDKPVWQLRCHVSPSWILCANNLNIILARLWRYCRSHSLWACRKETKCPVGHLYVRSQSRIHLHRGRPHQRPPWHPLPHSWAHQNKGQPYHEVHPNGRPYTGASSAKGLGAEVHCSTVGAGR